MCGFLIINLFALFSIPFAAAAVRTLCGQIKEARFDDPYYGYSKTFDKGDVYLYEIDSLSGLSYELEDDSGELSPRFRMLQHNTVVTDDRITVRHVHSTILIFTLDGDNVAFYQNLWPIEDFDHEFPVTRAARGGETLENVFAVNAIENELNDWILSAVDSDGPRLIFPLRYVRFTHEFEDIDKAVSFVFEKGPNVKEITLEFQYSGVAKIFHAFVDSQHTGYTSSDEAD